VDHNRDANNRPKSSFVGGKARRLETQAYFDRLWLVDPEHLDPSRNCMEQERIERTLELIEEEGSLNGIGAVDLGCGCGALSAKLQEKGARILAVDISNNALKILRERYGETIQTTQDYIPMTTLPDHTYDLVVCTELIAHLHPDEYRLLFAELARLVKPEGHVVVSTSLDINSTDALQKFADLAETEINIVKWRFSWHLFYIRIKDFFTAPSRFVRANRDHEYRLRELKIRFALSRWWFRFNSSTIPAAFWFVIQYLCLPIVSFLKKNRSFLSFLEKGCRLLCSESGISQAILIGKKRPLLEKLPSDEIPREMKHKRQVWE
jgi:2-polyprenyl-3-methyl-5-hydroxy-6-metoxy-1,4-benzoquinol methylase